MGGNTQEIRSEDKPLLVLLPLVVGWIKAGKDLTEKEIRSMAKLHPKEFEYVQRNPISELEKVAEKYKNHKLYHDLIAIVFSEQGKKWLRNNSYACRKLGLTEFEKKKRK